jgi:hypothetical protein
MNASRSKEDIHKEVYGLCMELIQEERKDLSIWNYSSTNNK